MEKLFSYGTLQQSAVQLATFGRLLQGQADQLPGYITALLKISDPAVVAVSGKAYHPVLQYSGNPEDKVPGMVFDITAAELQQADSYEAADYIRTEAITLSGQRCWIYTAANEPGKG
ncbi:gamma-glutamylcyclotransferase [Chromatiaceae bacterium AAb-1]|nr:gamma-glutamylcyclotransferase [Chromatiaceae bacterium AAb-1]